MKREILCEPCDKRQRKHLAQAFGDFLAPVGEHVKRISGKLLRTCMCDSCAEHLVAGERAVAVSMWSDHAGGPYYEWEHEFLDVPREVAERVAGGGE